MVRSTKRQQSKLKVSSQKKLNTNSNRINRKNVKKQRGGANLTDEDEKNLTDEDEKNLDFIKEGKFILDVKLKNKNGYYQIMSEGSGERFVAKEELKKESTVEVVFSLEDKELMGTITPKVSLFGMLREKPSPINFHINSINKIELIMGTQSSPLFYQEVEFNDKQYIYPCSYSLKGINTIGEIFGSLQKFLQLRAGTGGTTTTEPPAVKPGEAEAGAGSNGGGSRKKKGSKRKNLSKRNKKK